MVIALLLTITVSVAQQLDLMPFHYVDVNSQVEGYEVLNLMRQRDGDYVSKSAIAYDVVFYKVSPTSLEITDSLCIHHQDGMGWYDMIAQDPRGEGNLCVTTVPDDEGGVNLRISHFNDNSFVVDPSEDIVVPLCDREILYYSEGMIDCRGDIIWKYYPALTDSTWESHFARIGLDGTLKHDATLTPDGIFIDFGVFSEQPLRYYQWMGDENLMLFMYDSLFQQENYYVINKGFHPEYDPSLVYFEFSSYTWNKSFLIPDEGDVLVAATYNDFSSGPGWPNYDDLEVGTAVA